MTFLRYRMGLQGLFPVQSSRNILMNLCERPSWTWRRLYSANRRPGLIATIRRWCRFALLSWNCPR